MKQHTKLTCRRTLALCMSVLMLLTAWVFVAPTKAAAEGAYYQKITSTDEMVDGGQYLIVYENYCYALDGSMDANDLDSVDNYIEVDFYGDKIVASEEIDESAFTIDTVNGLVRSAGGYYIGLTETQNKLNTSASTDLSNTFAFDNGDFFLMSDSGNPTYYLQFNNNAGQSRFRFYKGTQQNIQLYMKMPEPPVVSVWDGTVPSSAPEGFVENDNTYIIRNVEDMVWFLKSVGNGTTYSGKTVILDADLDFNNLEANSINTTTTRFQGTFEGQGHTIYNFKLTPTANGFGLFRYISGATIRELNMEAVDVSTTSSYMNIGAVVGYVAGSSTLENIHVKSGSISGVKEDVGGVVGWAVSATTLTDCSNAASVSVPTGAGGLVGGGAAALTFTRCSNTGTVSGTDQIGGLLGRDSRNVTMTDCSNTGTVNASNEYCGGFIGRFEGSESTAYSLTIQNSTNTGTVSGVKYLGGMVGQSYLNNLIMTGCTNEGTVKDGSDQIGGLVGGLEQTKSAAFINCQNTGAVSGTSTVGGIAGYGNAGATFTGCSNTGSVTSTAGSQSGNTGGIIGYFTKATYTFTDCWNIGTIKGNAHVGGIGGFARYDGIVVIMDRCWNAGTITNYSIGTTLNTGATYNKDLKAGLLGLTERAGSSFNNCYNWGDILSTRMAAGIFHAGEESGGSSVACSDVHYCYNSGNLHGAWSYTIGWNQGNSVSADNYYNSGKAIEVYANGYERLEGATAKTEDDFVEYNFVISNAFGRNSNGVTINGTTYYYPILVQANTVATMNETTYESGLFRTTVRYNIFNLTRGSSFSGGSVVEYDGSAGYSDDQTGYFTLHKKSFQTGSNATGKSTGLLIADLSKYHDLRETGMYMQFYPHVYSAVGKVRYGVKLYPYSGSIPDLKLMNEYNSVTVTSDKGKTYTYTLCDAEGNTIQSALSADGNFTKNQTVASSTELDMGPYNIYIKGKLPGHGESVTIRMVAMVMAKAEAENGQLLSEWTDITITGRCFHAGGWTINNENTLSYTCNDCGMKKDSECPAAALEALPTAAGSTLADGVVYHVASDTTITAGTNQNGLVVPDYATVAIYIPENVTLTVNGGKGTDAVTPSSGRAGELNGANAAQSFATSATGNGGKAAINVPPTATLIIAGGGTLKATGGNGGNAANGANGAEPYMYAPSSDIDDWYAGGAGGAGGAGAGGGGAAIGGNGGNGGKGGNGGSADGGASISYGNDSSGAPGSPGSNGAVGEASGTVYTTVGVTVLATGGTSGSKGAGGSGGSAKTDAGSGYSNSYTSTGGGGGGGGAAGTNAAAIGGGGAGGGGGGGGATGCRWSATSYKSYRALGGTGGNGGNANGGNGFNGDQYGELKGEISGGGAGNTGSSGGCGSYATGLTNTDDRVSALLTKHAFLNEQNGTPANATVQDIIIGDDMPATSVLTRTGYEFNGYYSAVSGGGTKYYNADGTSAHFADFDNGELYAYWSPIEYQISYTLDDGTAENPATYTIESDAITLNNPTKTGCTFKGWSGTDLTGEDNKTVTIPAGSTGDRSYTANWLLNVTFSPASDGGYTVASAPAATVEEGNDVTFSLTLDAAHSEATPSVTATNGTVTSSKEGNTITYTVSNITAATEITVGAATINTYTVTWKNWDGTVLETDEDVSYGTAPHYDGTTPVKAPDADLHYVFDGWDDTSNVQGDKVITATYTSAAHVFDQQSTDAKYLKSGATCTEKAVYYYSCSCGYTGTETFESGDLLSHDMTFVPAVAGADCKHFGTVGYYHCSSCDKNYTDEAGTTVLTDLSDNTYGAHQLGELTTAVEGANCQETGLVAHYTCGVCGKYFSDVAATTELTTLDSGVYGPHDYNVLQSDATDHWYKCVNCDATTAKEAHTGGTATCTEKATCEVCDTAYGDLLDHDYSVLQHDATNHWYKCANCDATTEKEAHKGGTATCTEKATCEVCDTAYGDLLDHDYSVLQHDATDHWYKCANCDATSEKAAHTGGTATCTEQAKCEVCDAAYGELDYTNHSTNATETKNAKDPGYTFKGYTGDIYCAACDHLIATGSEIAKLNLADNETVQSANEILAAEEAAPGTYGAEKIAALQQALTDLETLANGTDEDAVLNKIAAIGEMLETIAPEVYVTVTFTVDGETVSTQTIKAGADATAPEQAAYIIDGDSHKVFSGWTGDYTGVTADVTITATYTTEAHNWADGDVTKAATCMATGTQMQTCVCGATNEKTLEIDPANHTGNTTTTRENEVAATCTAAGSYDEVVTCECGVELSRETKTIAQKQHSFTNYVFDNNAECTKDGTETAACDFGCGATDTRTKAGSALGHDWGDWVVTKEATCTETGTQVRTCTRDGAHTETMTTPMLDHSDANGDTLCDDCGAPMPNHQHTDDDHDNVCDTCHRTIDTGFRCSWCDKNDRVQAGSDPGIYKLIYRIVHFFVHMVQSIKFFVHK